MRRAFDIYSDDTDGQTFKYLNVFARIESCKKWADIRRNLAKNKDEQYNPDAPAPATLAGRPELSQKKLKELKKVGHPAERLQASFDKCWADAMVHAAGRDNKYDVRWKEMLANQGVRIALLKATSTAKKRNTDLAFLIGGNKLRWTRRRGLGTTPIAKTSFGLRRLLRPPLRRCPLWQPRMLHRPRRRKGRKGSPMSLL
jgi:hypothetical protein